MKKSEYSVELQKLLEDMKVRPSTIKNRWKDLSKEEREIYIKVSSDYGKAQRQKLYDIINKED